MKKEIYQHFRPEEYDFIEKIEFTRNARGIRINE